MVNANYICILGAHKQFLRWMRGSSSTGTMLPPHHQGLSGHQRGGGGVEPPPMQSRSDPYALWLLLNPEDEEQACSLVLVLWDLQEVLIFPEMREEKYFLFLWSERKVLQAHAQNMCYLKKEFSVTEIYIQRNPFPIPPQSCYQSILSHPWS